MELPQDICGEDEIKAMPSIIRGQYIEKTIEKTLELNSDSGATVDEINRNLGFDKRVISKYLEVLVAKRSAYKVIRGNSITYFKNGKLIHHILNKDLIMKDRTFSFKALFDGKEVFLYIQENRKNKLGLIEEGGGIIVPIKDLSLFADTVKKIEKETPEIREAMQKQILEVIG